MVQGEKGQEVAHGGSQFDVDVVDVVDADVVVDVVMLSTLLMLMLM